MRSALPSRVFDNGYGSSPSWSSVLRIPHGVAAVGSLSGSRAWIAEEARCSSRFQVSLSAEITSNDLLHSAPFARSLNAARRRARAHQCMTPSAWGSSVINWAAGSTRMKTKLLQVDRCFWQARYIPGTFVRGTDTTPQATRFNVRFGLLEPRAAAAATMSTRGVRRGRRWSRAKSST